MKPIYYIIIGFILVLLGVVLPLLMTISVIESTLFLGFFSYIASIIGLFLGMWGAFSFMRIERIKRKKKDDEQGYRYTPPKKK